MHSNVYGKCISEALSEHSHIICHFAHFVKCAELKGPQWRAQW